MKRQAYSIMAAALLLASGALLTTACSNEDEAIDNSTPDVGGGEAITFTATLAPKGGATTRAITVNDQGTANETLTTTWAVGEVIAIYYEYGTNSHEYSGATVQTVNADGSATITATFPSKYKPNNGSAAKFMYPAYLMNDYGNVRFNYEPDGMGLCHQYGYLTGDKSIGSGIDVTSHKGSCDLCIGYGTLAVEGSDVTVNGTVAMENEVCICKFKFDFDHNGTGIPVNENPSFTPITIDDGDGHTYTIESDKPDDGMFAISGSKRGFRSTDDIYVALLPISGKTVTFTATRKGSTDTYTCTKSNVTLQKGKFYRNLGTITLVKQ